MAEQFSRRSFLKGGALTVGAFAFGGFPRIDTAMAAPQEKAKVFFTKDISLEGLMKVYARVNHGMSGKIDQPWAEEPPQGSTAIVLTPRG